MNFFTIILLILYSQTCNTQISVQTPCNYYNVDTNSLRFNLTKFLGRWYEMKTYSPYIEAGKCIYDDFKRNEKNGQITITHTELTSSQTENSTGIVISNAKNLLTWTFTVTRLDVNILQTDYESFAILWSCKNESEHSSNQYLWIWGRTWMENDIPWSLVNLTLYTTRLMDNNMPLYDVQQDVLVCGKDGKQPLLFSFNLLILLIFTKVI